MKMLVQGVKLDISFVHKIVGVCFYRYLIHNFGIVNLLLSDEQMSEWNP